MMRPLVRTYAKAVVAFLSLAAAGGLLIVLGYDDVGLPMLSTAPFVSGLVATVGNVPRSARSRSRRR